MQVDASGIPCRSRYQALRNADNSTHSTLADKGFDQLPIA